MRAAMSKKPLDFPREYFEVHCTTAQKRYFEYMAFSMGYKSPGAYVAHQMTKKDMPIDEDKSQKEWIKHWEEKLATAKAGSKAAELHNQEFNELQDAVGNATRRVKAKYKKIKDARRLTK